MTNKIFLYFDIYNLIYIGGYTKCLLDMDEVLSSKIVYHETCNFPVSLFTLAVLEYIYEKSL